ncbi:PD-(D/E)XK motif protein [Dactylosporangium sp. NPDC050688]|uniref:PD-(D/E)XK motif protein n=1 Tax=Dactylosporangium sp. NPDC050688 TaxID=3157217 RepID=UPI0033E163FF
MSDDLRRIVADHWDALQAGSGTGWLTSDLPVRAADTPLRCAIDPEGARHLLVPLSASDEIRPDTRAAAVHLLTRTLQGRSAPARYADLVLLRPDLQEVFTGLCADVLAAVALEPADPPGAVQRVLNGWHELLRSGSPLGLDQLTGLFGELTVLNAVLDRNIEALGAWTGPTSSSHDFLRNARAIEVKSTTSGTGRAIRIHGVDQLDPPPGGELIVWWMRFDVSAGAGVSVPEIVEATALRLGEPSAYYRLLARAGYYLADAERYGGIRFTLMEQACYRVVGDFPRIVPDSFVGGLPNGVRDLRYTVDLDAAPSPMPVPTGDVSAFLTAMAAP